MKMNSLINICNLSKKYDNTDFVIADFSYSFKKNGFYVLFGHSGSGKTTLLNIICGLVSFESGKIYFNNQKYVGIVDKDYISPYITYITQDSYFVDYLTVNDNIKLCSDNEVEIQKLMKQFSLEDKMDKYPTQLSSGEKQRLSLVQSLLKGKKIFILDEPTSSLDRENKLKIFRLLKELKNDILIICSTHDVEIFDYCDEVINFENLDKYNCDNIDEKETDIIEKPKSYSVPNLYKYVKKQYKNNSKNKKINILLCIVFILSILISFFCFNIKDKLLKTVQTKYHVNYLTVYCPIKDNSYLCDTLFDSNGVTEVSFVYSLNIPLQMQSEEGFVGNLNFSTDLITLPSNLDNFPFKNKILYGNYLENDNEIMLGYDMALEYNFTNPKELISTKINIKTPDGINEFKIVGIFDRFNDVEKQYFKTGEIQTENVDSKYFISSEFNKKYIDDDLIGYNEKNLNKAVYYVYFKNFNDLYQVYQKYIENNINEEDKIYISSFPNQYLDIMGQFNNLSVFLYPIFIISTVIAIIFYYQSLILDINYNYHIFSVYQFYGYNLKKIKNATIKSNAFNIIKNFGISLLISIIISIVINALNSKFDLIHYQIFTIDILSVAILFCFLLILSIIMSILIYKKIKSKGWYSLIRNSGDLI